MLIHTAVLESPHTLVLVLLMAAMAAMAAGVFGTRTGAQRGMFSAGDAYERFMGRWSRELAPLLVQFAGVRNGDFVR
jgi:hypothetical protein